MGYRSEVILAIGPEVMPQFMVTMAKSIEARAMCFGDAEVIKDYDGTKGAMLFRWDHIKWYDSYEEIRAIEDFMDWCDGEAIEVNGAKHQAADFFRFIRIGDEMGDTEVRGQGFWDVGVARSIEY